MYAGMASCLIPTCVLSWDDRQTGYSPERSRLRDFLWNESTSQTIGVLPTKSEIPREDFLVKAKEGRVGRARNDVERSCDKTWAIFTPRSAHLVMKNAGASIRIGSLGWRDACWFGTLSLKPGHPYANWLSQLLVMTAGRKSLFRAFLAILSRTPGASILILRPAAVLACPHYYRISLPATACNTLNLSNWFCAYCVHTALSCNVGSFSTECRDKPGLVDGIASKGPSSMNVTTQLSCWPSLWLSVDCQNWIGNCMPAWNWSILRRNLIFRIETELNFSNCQWILVHRLSIAIDAENLANVTQFAQFPHFAHFAHFKIGSAFQCR